MRYLLNDKIFFRRIWMKQIGRLHILTDVQIQNRFTHARLAEMAIAGGADTIQFRQKQGSTREMIGIARDIKRMCEKAGVTLIVNDRLDIAIAADADGVHLGQDDFPISLGRTLLGADKIIGGSARNIEEAHKCLSQGADYIGFGPVYPTMSKEDAGPAMGIEILKRISEEIALPVIAIGGIDSGNIHEVMRSGAYGVAVISAVCCRPDPEQATRILKEALNYGSNTGGYR
jgi:thiamine-phosphate pyrophosphorylase